MPAGPRSARRSKQSAREKRGQTGLADGTGGANDIGLLARTCALEADGRQLLDRHSFSRHADALAGCELDALLLSLPSALAYVIAY